MVPQLPRELDFQNVRYENRIEDEAVKLITFTVDGYPYALQVKGIYPSMVFHDPFRMLQQSGWRFSQIEDKECPLCGGEFSPSGGITGECDILSPCVDEVFEQLKDYPQVRLRLLFE